MSLIKDKNTGPELRVRSALHRRGYRYKIHDACLPGKPDIVFTARRCVIQVHGCFWHRHPGCRFAPLPATRREFWERKFNTNQLRDVRVAAALSEQGWRLLTVWECETRHPDALLIAMENFLGPPRGQADG